MATTSLDDSPTTVQLTAADKGVMETDAISQPQQSATPTSTAEQISQQVLGEKQNEAKERLDISSSTNNSGSTAPENPQTPPRQIKPDTVPIEPAIPQTPDVAADDPEFPAVSMADYQQLNNLTNLMAQYDTLRYAAGSLANLSVDDLTMGSTGIDTQALVATASRHDETRISAYAMLEFEDGQFYMNTYQVILGRDLAAARAAMRRDAELAKVKLEEEEEVREPKTPIRIKREGSKYNKSIISESGGILREGDDSDSDSRARRRMQRKASKKTKSTGSSSLKLSRRDSLVAPIGKIDYQPQSQTRRHAPETAGAVPVDPASLRPSPHDCPLVGIHPPATTPASGYKAISRQHVKIAYNFKKSLFEAEIIGRNGAFVDDIFYYHEDVIPLKSGSYLQIGGVVVRFILPDVAIGETGAEHPIDQDEAGPNERYVEGGKEMSFEFEEETREGISLGDSSDEESSEADRHTKSIETSDEPKAQKQEDEQHIANFDDDDDDNSDLSDVPDDEEEEGNEVQNEQQPVRHQLPEHMHIQQSIEGMDPSLQMPPKKRGPGRPPKNGIMSKREQQLAKKEAQARALQQELAQYPEHSLSGKNKVGRPRKHPEAESPVKTEKRKYTKRKPKDPNDPNQEGSEDENGEKRDKKEKKSTKPPRSPSPVFNEADLTPEQLAKPQANYVTLIHEALSNSPTGQMSLPQIYRAIQRRYPFFVLKCNTNGWQSSVRHNLSQHHAFRKVERDGKGWMWAIVDGVSIEKEKKRRPTPPHQYPPHLQQQPIYRAGPPYYGPPGTMPPPGYGYPNMPPHMRPGYPPPYPGQHVNGYPMPPNGQPMNGMPPQGYPPPVQIPPPLAPSTGTYSSPYAPKPVTNGAPNPASQGTPPNPSPAPQHQQPQQPQPPAYVGMQPRPPQPVQHMPPPPAPAAVEDPVPKAFAAFKNTILPKLKQKSAQAEAIFESAANRVLGKPNPITLTLEDSKVEGQIFNALKGVLSTIGKQQPQPQQLQPVQQPPQHHQQQMPRHLTQPQAQPPQGQMIQQGVPGQQPQQASPPLQQQPQTQQPLQAQPQDGQRQPLAQVNPQSTAPVQAFQQQPVAKPAVPAPIIQRPSFGNQMGRPGGPPVPRPPMNTPWMARAPSGSPATPTPTNLASASPTQAPPASIQGTPTVGTPAPVAQGLQAAQPVSASPVAQATPPQQAPLAVVGQVQPQMQGQIQPPVQQTVPQVQPQLTGQTNAEAIGGQAPAPAPAPQTQQQVGPTPQVPQPGVYQPAPATVASPPAAPVAQVQPAPQPTALAPADPTPAATAATVNENGKRPLEEESSIGEEPDFKRLSTTGPPALKA
jgi:hypothetical protein